METVCWVARLLHAAVPGGNAPLEGRARRLGNTHAVEGFANPHVRESHIMATYRWALRGLQPSGPPWCGFDGRSIGHPVLQTELLVWPSHRVGDKAWGCCGEALALWHATPLVADNSALRGPQ